MDCLRRRVLARDAKNNTARQMEVTTTAPVTRRICVKCRRIPTYAEHRAKWLAENPTPETRPIDVPISRLHDWGEDQWVGWRMPIFELRTECMSCGGALVTVTW